ncbi:DUF3309 family protein [Azospirillum sp. ST 5-10]|uniref:DUF3309 family protein n=1 Tax=unclassified Azospirillum TaxID=2630922 RepID=UPI003F4A03A8
MTAFLLLLALIAVFLLTGPWWPYSRGWGYGPSGVVLALLVLWFALVWWGALVLALPWAA